VCVPSSLTDVTVNRRKNEEGLVLGRWFYIGGMEREPPSRFHVFQVVCKRHPATSPFALIFGLTLFCRLIREKQQQINKDGGINDNQTTSSKQNHG